MSNDEIVIYRSWISQLTGIVIFIAVCAGCAIASTFYTNSVVTGPIFPFGSYRIYLDLPTLMLMPFGKLVYLLWKAYDAKFIIDSRGIEMTVGMLSLSQKRVKVRYEDIRAIELEQTILARILNYGDVLIGSAATGEIEIIIDSVAAPKEVQEMIQVERDRRLRLKSKATDSNLSLAAGE